MIIITRMKVFSILNLIIFIALLFSSCSSVFTKIYGIKEVKYLNNEKINKYADKYNIPKECCFKLDTAFYTFLISFDTNLYKLQINNHYQPLQALYYNREGVLKSFQVNCYAGGFPNLNWNRNEIMASFPPKIQAPPDSLISLENLLKYAIPINEKSVLLNEKTDYTVIVFWNKFMGRQSKRLIKSVQQNAKLASEVSHKIIYINNDNLYLIKQKK